MKQYIKFSEKRYQCISYRDIPVGSEYERVVGNFYRQEAARVLQSRFQLKNKIFYFLHCPGSSYRTQQQEQINDLKKYFIEKQQEHIQQYIIVKISSDLYAFYFNAQKKLVNKQIFRHPRIDAQYQEILDFISTLPKNRLIPAQPIEILPLTQFLTKPNRIIEPLDDVPMTQLVEQIKKQAYESLCYTLPDFERYLLKALRLGLINQDELLTAKLLYDSRDVFGEVKMIRHDLTDPNGPYHPEKLIRYWPEEVSVMLKDTPASTLIYYTIDFSNAWVRFILHHAFMDDRIDGIFFNNSVISPIWEKMIRAYATDADQKTQLLSALNQLILTDNMSLEEKKSTRIQYAEPMLYFLQTAIAETMDGSEADRYDALFIADLAKFDSSLPLFCVSPNYTEESKKSPIMSFVVPTMKTFRWLNRMLHGDETTEAQPMISAGQVKQIRALDELPGVCPDAYTPVQKSLSLLFPEAAKIENQARLVELKIPGVLGTDSPHGYACHSFLLSYHDLFHVWNNSQNFKKIWRKLRLIHDEKGGFLLNRQGMSKMIWTLSDMGLSMGAVFRNISDSCVPRDEITCRAFFRIFQEGGFISHHLDENIYLLMYDVLQSESLWRDLLHGQSFDDFLINLGRLEHLEEVINALLLAKNKMATYLMNHPGASVVACMLYDFFSSEEAEQYINRLDSEESDSFALMHLSQSEFERVKHFYHKKDRDAGIKHLLEQNQVPYQNLVFSAEQVRHIRMTLQTMSVLNIEHKIVGTGLKALLCWSVNHGLSFTKYALNQLVKVIPALQEKFIGNQEAMLSHALIWWVQNLDAMKRESMALSKTDVSSVSVAPSSSFFSTTPPLPPPGLTRNHDHDPIGVRASPYGKEG